MSMRPKRAREERREKRKEGGKEGGRGNTNLISHCSTGRHNSTKATKSSNVIF